MKIFKAAIATLSLTTLVGCAGSASLPPSGVIFSSFSGPGQFTTGETTNPGGTAISGEACANSILGLVATGDYSIDAALKNAGAEGKTLKNVAVDGSFTTILGLYSTYCTKVNARVAM